MNSKLYKSSKKTIVAIDDSSIMLSFLQAYLSNEFEVKTYTSGSSAMADLLAKNIQPDCILTDYEMPGDINGLEILKKVKDYNQTLPVIMLSGNCTMDQKIESLNHGANDFMCKPFNPMELVVRLNTAISISENIKMEYSYAV